MTDRDLAMRLVADKLDAGSVTVDRVVSAFPAFSNPHRDLRAAIDVMLEMGVRRLPAVNAKGQVVGVLSLDDILIDLAGQMGKIKALLELERDQPNVAMAFTVDADAYR